MPTTFDNIFNPLAKQLIDNTFGFAVTYRQRSRTYSAATGKNVNVDTDTPIQITPPSPYDQRRVNGTTIFEGDQYTYMSSASAITPRSGDFIVQGGEEWQIVSVSPLQSGELTPAYEMQLRK